MGTLKVSSQKHFGGDVPWVLLVIIVHLAIPASSLHMA